MTNRKLDKEGSILPFNTTYAYFACMALCNLFLQEY